MVALQIRDVPPEVRDTLVERARGRGQSLQGLLLSLVEDEARRAGNVAVLNRFGGRSDGSRVSSSETADELDELRTAHDHRPDGC